MSKTERSIKRSIAVQMYGMIAYADTLEEARAQAERINTGAGWSGQATGHGTVDTIAYEGVSFTEQEFEEVWAMALMDGTLAYTS